MYRVQVQISPRYSHQASEHLVRAATRAALGVGKAPSGASLSVALAGDAALRRLNRTFLGQDYATDVLSFPAQEADGRYLGDIAISVPRARAQARAGGHPLRAELQLLVVHGVLHLLGHDHARPADRRRMWAAQARALRALGAPISGPAGPSP